VINQPEEQHKAQKEYSNTTWQDVNAKRSVHNAFYPSYIKDRLYCKAVFICFIFCLKAFNKKDRHIHLPVFFICRFFSLLYIDGFR